MAVDSLALLRPRAVGVETVGLWALQQLGVPALLVRLGLTGPQRAAALGSIIGRLAAPGSERATHAWLGQRSALGELLEVDFEALSAMQLYRASDTLLAHRETIEQHLFRQVSDLFGLAPTVTLYDLTNTYFEGEAGAQPKARRGHSKEKRSDCPLLTLGLVLDGSGFVRRSQVFAGNVREDSTLAAMLTALDAPAGALVVLDRGIATEANIAWLREQGYRYLVVSRARHRQFDLEQAVTIDTASGQPLHLHLEQGEGETRLYCYSAARAEKEKGIAARLQQRFETGLQRLADGLSRPRTRKSLNSIHQRIGRLREQNRGIAQHYDIEVKPDVSGKQAASITWQRRPQAGSLLTHPGVYCLRSNLTDWDAEKAMAHLHPVDRPGGRVPLAQIRVGAAPSVSPDAAARRRPPVYHRAGLSSRATHPPASAGARGAGQLVYLASYPGRATAGDRHLPVCRPPDLAYTQGHAPGSGTTGHLSGVGHRREPRRHSEDDRVMR